MKAQTRLYDSVYQYLAKGSEFVDKRHLSTLSWMVSALLSSLRLNLNGWEPYVVSRAQQSQSYQRRWSRFLGNARVATETLYVPLVRAAIGSWQPRQVYVAIDSTVLWNRYCLVFLAVICCGRAVPLMWVGLEQASASVAFEHYQPLLERAVTALAGFKRVVLLADRGFANQEMVRWLEKSPWHWRIRVPSDTRIYINSKGGFGFEVRQLRPPKGHVKLYHQAQVWAEARFQCNLALASMRGAKDSWAIITDEPPTLDTFWEYGFRFCVEELFLDSKSGVFDWEGSRVRNVPSLERLYLVVAVAVLFATLQGMAVQRAGLRRHVDSHRRRGLSYLKVGLRWLAGVIHKGRKLLPLDELFYRDPEPCFASAKAQAKDLMRFPISRVQHFDCYPQTP